MNLFKKIFKTEEKEKKVIIHFGLSKTGSSSIQKWLNNNRKLLGKNKIFYPVHQLDSNGISSGNVNSVMTLSSERVWNIDYDKINKLKKLFHKSKYDILLLSSEVFLLIIEELNDFFPNVSFIGYLRNPIEHQMSSYNQSVKRNFCVKKFKISKTSNHYNKIKNLPFSINLIIKPFLKNTYNNWNVIKDFIEFFKMDIPIKIKSNFYDKVNKSYSFEVLELKRNLNMLKLNMPAFAQLDRVLQSCEFGTNKYSLIDDNEYINYVNYFSKELKLLIDNNSSRFSLLNKLILNMQDSKNAPYVQQGSVKNYEKIIEFIYLKDKALFYDLKKQLELEPNLPLEGNIYEVFKCPHL